MKNGLGTLIQIGFVGLIIFGLYLRFVWVDWSQGANLHPDEYGLTNTLTQLSLPKSVADYFNTRISPLSPYPRYDETGQPVANGPDNGMRWGQWPMIIIRFVTEITGNTSYDKLRLTGRTLSALADSLSLLLIFLIGSRLYSKKIGLMAAALSAMAVLQIQQSHFMTVDNFSVLFASLALYACVHIAQHPVVYRASSISAETAHSEVYLPNRGSLLWYLVFGVAFGMALASKINLLPLGGIVLVAGFIGIADLRLRTQRDLRTIFFVWAVYTSLAILTALLTFRLTQPMSFRQISGDTTFLTIHLNPDWVRNMQQAQSESNGFGGGPPAEQWAHRPAIIFPWINMVLWGMGLPLGLMSWAGFVWAAWRILRSGDQWRAHLIPLIWTGGYFIFIATRWVKSIRYFLPIYTFMSLFAAWGLVTLWRKYSKTRSRASRTDPSSSGLLAFLPAVVTIAVILGATAWALVFVQAVYGHDHTRIQATHWIFENIPGPFHLAILDLNGNPHYEPVAAPDGLVIDPYRPFVQPFTSRINGQLVGVIIPHIVSQNGAGQIRITISTDQSGNNPIVETIIPAKSMTLPGQEARGEFQQAELKQGIVYYLIARTLGPSSLTISRTVISNESWDEGLPFPFDNRDPFGQLYRGVTMGIRWFDGEDKRKMFIDTLAQADYVILPSQRAIWSTCRIPSTYPMTMEYYRALFDGRLGFDLVALFSAPFQLGPLQVSDVGGTIALNHTPSLPLFNHNLLTAEEAFSVYDHPPVWVFRKRPDFSQEIVTKFFNSMDLSKVVIQSAREASLSPCP